MESMECGVVSDITSPSGLEPSEISSLFLGAFLGAMIPVLGQKPVYRESAYKTK
jgi:hypothetical protein